MLDLQILTSYLCRFDLTLTLETLQGIESQFFRKESYFRSRLKTLTEEAMEKGLQQGLQMGKEQGIHLGKKQGIHLGKEQGIEYRWH